jgi:hypothetical protein
MSADSRGVLLAITAAALLRVVGLDFGLPYRSNFYIRPDETLVLVPALRWLDPTPAAGSLVYPALLPALCAALFHLYFWLGGGAPSLAAHFAQDPTPYVLLARAVSVAAGTATTVLVYRLGRRLGPRVGVLAALLYAVAPLPVRDAHFAVTDTLMTMLAAAAVWALLRHQAAPATHERRWLLLAAAAIGLAVSAKYPAAVLLAPAVVVVAVRAWPGGPRRVAADVALALAVSAVAFLLVNPGTLLRARETAHAVLAVVRAVSSHEAGWSLLPALARMLAALRYGPGELVGLAAAALGVGLAWRRDAPARRAVAVVAGAAVLFAAPLLLARILPFRYALPVMPFVAVLAAHGLLALRWPGPPRLARALAALLAAACVLPAAARAAWIDAVLTREDTRSEAGRWIEAHVPAGVPIVLLGGPECEPQIAESRASIGRRIRYVRDLYGPAAGAVVGELYRVQLEGPPPPDGREVFRRPAAFEPAGRGVCLVVPSYPLPNPACPARALPEPFAGLARGATVRARFEGVAAGVEGASVDAVDAFFLPFSRLSAVRRPGPDIEALLVPAGRPAP